MGVIISAELETHQRSETATFFRFRTIIRHGDVGVLLQSLSFPVPFINPVKNKTMVLPKVVVFYRLFRDLFLTIFAIIALSAVYRQHQPNLLSIVGLNSSFVGIGAGRAGRTRGSDENDVKDEEDVESGVSVFFLEGYYPLTLGRSTIVSAHPRHEENCLVLFVFLPVTLVLDVVLEQRAFRAARPSLLIHHACQLVATVALFFVRKGFVYAYFALLAELYPVVTRVFDLLIERLVCPGASVGAPTRKIGGRVDLSGPERGGRAVCPVLLGRANAAGSVRGETRFTQDGGIVVAVAADSEDSPSSSLSRTRSKPAEPQEGRALSAGPGRAGRELLEYRWSGKKHTPPQLLRARPVARMPALLCSLRFGVGAASDVVFDSLSGSAEREGDSGLLDGGVCNPGPGRLLGQQARGVVLAVLFARVLWVRVRGDDVVGKDKY